MDAVVGLKGGPLLSRVPIWYQIGIITLMAMTVRVDEEMERALAALAEAEGASRQEVVRRAVLERYERSSHVSRVDESAGRLADRWGDVLRRLGDA